MREVKAMKYTIILFALLFLFFNQNSFGADEFFTWKDGEGKVHVTDTRPPDGVEIIEITPRISGITLEKLRQRSVQQEAIRHENQRSSIKRQAVKARAQEKEARQAAEEFTRQAKEIRERREGTRSKKRYRTKVSRNEKEAAKYDKKAVEMLKEAEVAGRLAESLEKRLGK